MYTKQSIYRAVPPFLINSNEKQCSESNILTMDYKLVFENSSLAAVYTLPNHYLFEGCQVLEYQTETDLLNKP